MSVHYELHIKYFDENNEVIAEQRHEVNPLVLASSEDIYQWGYQSLRLSHEWLGATRGYEQVAYYRATFQILTFPFGNIPLTLDNNAWRREGEEQ